MLLRFHSDSLEVIKTSSWLLWFYSDIILKPLILWGLREKSFDFNRFFFLILAFSIRILVNSFDFTELSYKSLRFYSESLSNPLKLLRFLIKFQSREFDTQTVASAWVSPMHLVGDRCLSGLRDDSIDIGSTDCAYARRVPPLNAFESLRCNNSNYCNYYHPLFYIPFCFS